MNSRARVSDYVLTGIAMLVILFPLFWMVSVSLKSDMEQFAIPPTLLPVAPTLNSYEKLFDATNFVTYAFNSLVVGVFTVALSLAIASPASYALTRFPFLSKPMFSAAVLFIYMFPPILLGVPLFIIFARLGLTNSLFGLVLAHTTFALPFVIWMLRDFFLAIPKDVEDSAMVDGCNRMDVLWRIALPMVRPGLIAAGIFTFILSWNDYIYALILIKSESAKTLSLGISMFLESTSIEPGLMMSSGVLITAPVLVMFMFIQKYLVQGLGAGSVK